MDVIATLEKSYRKPQVAAVQSGDTVRVHQLIREGNKQRVQVFEGVVIRTRRKGQVTAVITVRRIASGVGVEKTFLLHSPNVQKVEVMRRAKVRRNFLSYLRGRRGKSARLTELAFDKAAVNVSDKPVVEEAPVAEDVVADASNDDADVTEVEESISVEADESLTEVEKQENKEAAEGDEPHQTDDAGEEGDESAAVSDEVEEGLAKANDEDDRAQKTT
jgi:large subunit ribosomal protein L19